MIPNRMVYLGNICKTIIGQYTPYSRAKYIFDSLRLITAENPLIFSIIYANDEKYQSVTTKVRMDIIYLKIDCSAFNTDMYILPLNQCA